MPMLSFLHVLLNDANLSLEQRVCTFEGGRLQGLAPLRQVPPSFPPFPPTPARSVGRSRVFLPCGGLRAARATIVTLPEARRQS